MRIIYILLFLILISCNNTSNKVEEKLENPIVSVESEQKDDKHPENINYLEFNPNTLSDFKLVGYDIEKAYKLGSKIIVTGYDKKTNPDANEDWGDQLLLLNTKNEILFKSKGVGDVYLFEPHFYKNETNDKIIIVCQLAYEYFFGGEAFLYENGQVEYIGNIDIEGKYEQTNLIDILQLNERNNEIFFTFNSDSITYKPSNDAVILKNTTIRYEYKNKILKLIM